MEWLVVASVLLIIFTCFAYGVSTYSGCKVVMSSIRGADFSIMRVLRTLFGYALGCRIKNPSPFWNVIYFAAMLSTGASFLLCVLHIQYLVTKDFMALGLMDNLEWMIAHIFAAGSINAFHYAFILESERETQ